MTRPKPPKRSYGLDWYRDLEEGGDKELRTQLINGSAPVLAILAEIFRKRQEEIARKYDYDNYLAMANDLGRKKEIDYMLKLLTPTLLKE